MAFKIMIVLAGLAAWPCNAEFRDPTRPAYPLPATTANAAIDIDLTLSSIWISPHSKRATINGVSVRQGQTIVIEQMPRLNLEPAGSATTAATGDKKDAALNEVMEPALNLLNKYANTGINLNPLAPLRTAPAPSPVISPLPLASTQPSKTTRIPNSTTITIINIDKNSVTIEQKGEIKTLHLVQRSYKIH